MEYYDAHDGSHYGGLQADGDPYDVNGILDDDSPHGWGSHGCFDALEPDHPHHEGGLTVATVKSSAARLGAGTCPGCWGGGTDWNGGHTACSDCNGSGVAQGGPY